MNGTDPSGLWAQDPWWNDSGWDWANPWTYGWFRWFPNLTGGYYSSLVQGTSTETKQQVGVQERAIHSIGSDINADFNRFRQGQRLGENTTELLQTAASESIQFAAGAGSFASTTGIFRSFGSFRALKRGLGSAGEGMVWHHIVEQSQQGRFGANAIHTTANVVQVPTATNIKLNALYSSIRRDITGSSSLTVRQWLSLRSYEENMTFGLHALENINQGVWP